MRTSHYCCTFSHPRFSSSPPAPWPSNGEPTPQARTEVLPQSTSLPRLAIDLLTASQPPPFRSATMRSAHAMASPQPARAPSIDHQRTNFLNYVLAYSSADSSIASCRTTYVAASGSGEGDDQTLSRPHRGSRTVKAAGRIAADPTTSSPCLHQILSHVFSLKLGVLLPNGKLESISGTQDSGSILNHA
jgi:hypothetical protein